MAVKGLRLLQTYLRLICITKSGKCLLLGHCRLCAWVRVLYMFEGAVVSKSDTCVCVCVCEYACIEICVYKENLSF